MLKILHFPCHEFRYITGWQLGRTDWIRPEFPFTILPTKYPMAIGAKSLLILEARGSFWLFVLFLPDSERGPHSFGQERQPGN